MTLGLAAARSDLPGAVALFTGRSGGEGRGEFGALNLARHVGDDEAAVEANRSLLAEELGRPLVFVDQVHSAEVHVLPEDGPIPVATADAMVTRRRDVALAIMVADCLPVLLVDPVAGVIGAAHAGRRGLLDGILGATVDAMVGLGAERARIAAAVGPAICAACYEVPAEMRAEAERRLAATAGVSRDGTPAIDLRAGAVEALCAAGIPAAAIDADHACTREDERFYSYRRQAVTGRFAGIVALA
ncbi:peptidoglycan editing factor PgeF [Brachybacterium sp. DNPG3]